MPLIRANALRSFQSSLRSTATRAAPRARTQLVTRRFASSGGHGHAEPSSDLPWALGAVAVTIPSCWFLWPEESTGHHGGHDSHDSHGEEHAEEEKEDDSPADDAAPADDAEGKEDVKSEEKEEKSEEKSEEKEEKTEDNKEEKSEEKEDKSEEKEDKPDETKGSGGSTSTKGVKMGQGAKESQSASKPQGGGSGDISVKQGGMSNTDTKHSTPIEPGTEKSTKGDGNPETAKAKGTVDPKAPVK